MTLAMAQKQGSGKAFASNNSIQTKLRKHVFSRPENRANHRKESAIDRIARSLREPRISSSEKGLRVSSTKKPSIIAECKGIVNEIEGGDLYVTVKDQYGRVSDLNLPKTIVLGSHPIKVGDYIRYKILRFPFNQLEHTIEIDSPPKMPLQLERQIDREIARVVSQFVKDQFSEENDA